MNNIFRALASLALCSIFTNACIKGEFTIHRQPRAGAELKAYKLTASDCVDPDLSQVAKEVSMTLCNGSVAHGSYTIHTACTMDGQEQCIVADAYKAADTKKFCCQ